MATTKMKQGLEPVQSSEFEFLPDCHLHLCTEASASLDSLGGVVPHQEIPLAYWEISTCMWAM